MAEKTAVQARTAGATAGKPEAEPIRKHFGKVTVFNTSGHEVGGIVEGAMYAVPAGQPGGGPGVLVVPQHIAQELIRQFPGRLSLSSGGYTEADEATMRQMPVAELREFAAQLMRGLTLPLAKFRELYAAGSAQAGPDERPAGSAGSAAGGKAA